MCAAETNNEAMLQIIEFGPFSHQDLINAFAFTAAGLGSEDPWVLMTRAGINVTDLAADRKAPYSGTPLHALPDLSVDEKNLLMRQLDIVLKTMPVPPRQSSDGDGDGDKLTPLAPPVDEQLTLPENATWELIRVVETWNRYGGLLKEQGKQFNVDPSVLLAILLTESNGQAVDEDGRMTIRFEPHIFYSTWGQQNEAAFHQFFRYDSDLTWNASGQYEWRPDPTQPWRNIGSSQDEMWAAFDKARQLNETHAMSATSLGMAQLMGFNHRLVGYETVQAMFGALASSERAQLNGFFDFLRANGLADAIQQRDYRKIAEVYNGPGQVDLYANLISNWVDIIDRVRGPVEVDTPIAAAMPLPAAGPMPDAQTGGRPLRDVDPQLYEAWSEHLKQGYRNNQIMFNRILDGFMNPYHTTIWMYRIMFGVGIAAFVAAVVIALMADNAVTAVGGAAIFGGLSVVAFLSYFLNRPLQALEENLQFITWLGIVYNTYWTRLTYAMEMDSFHVEVEDATNDAVDKIKEMLEEHAKTSSNRPGLR